MPSDARPVQSRRDLARALSRASRGSIADLLAAEKPPLADPPWTIAITGPAGVGKSTLVSRLAPLRLARLQAVPGARAQDLLAVLAIDPTSPVSGGAILGDRIRMDAIAGDPAVFIRSIASGGSHGGLSRNIVNILNTAFDHGFAEVIVETVGAGQSEYAARHLADCVVLALQPDTGDFVQAMKSGLMEVADIYVVNKAQLPGAARTQGELESLLRYVTPASSGWHPLVVPLRDLTEVTALDHAVQAHRAAMTPAEIAERRMRREQLWLSAMVTRRIEEIAQAHAGVSDLPNRRARYAHVLRTLADDLSRLPEG